MTNRSPFPAGPPNWPRSSDVIRQALLAAWESGDWGRYHGRFTGEFLHDLTAYHRVAHGQLCCSGTIAVELALRGVGVDAGDEVILAGYDFPGNFRAIEFIGARPVLVDIERDTWCLTADAIAAGVSPQTKAVVVSHLHGGIAPMRSITLLAASRGIAVVEDACQAPGAMVDGRRAGTWGDVGVLSFGGSKLLTAGRGGAILTDREDVLQRARLFNERGNDAFPLSELQAAVLQPQLAELDRDNQLRWDTVRELLHGWPHAWLRPVKLPLEDSAEHRPSFYKLGFELTADAKVSREEFVAAMHGEGVAMDEGFRGFVRRSTRRCRKVGSLENSAVLAERTVLLHHPILCEAPGVMDRLAMVISRVGERFTS